MSTRRAVVLALSAFLCSCGDTVSDTDPSDTPKEQASSLTAGNNAATLEGPTLGFGASPNAALRKEITVQVMSPYPGITALRAWAIEVGDSVTNIAIELTNDGERPLCFVELQSISLVDGNGSALVENDSTYVHGSVADLGGQYTDTCLAAHETSLATMIEIVPQSSVSGVSVGAIDADDDPVNDPAPRIVATDYGEGNWRFSVNVTNQGSETGVLRIVPGIAFILDDQGIFLWDAYLGTNSGDPVAVGVGASISLSGTDSFPGTATRMLVRTSFDLAEGADGRQLSSADAISRQRLRAERERAKKLQHR